MEIKIPVTAVRVEMQCDVCGVANMVPTGRSQLTMPPLYEHQCEYCQKGSKYFPETYPLIRFNVPEEWPVTQTPQA